nr:hypothetical protein [Tanacetum cinerariifolium]
MSSDSHATITYTSMSNYKVIVNGYFEMPMDPLDPYVQLVMEAPPSPDYIPGPEAPPSPEYIPGPEYPEYLPPAEEQPLPAAVSPTAESPGNITDSEQEMELEEDDGDDEKSEGDSIEYSTSRGDDDGDDLSEDDVDYEDEEESSDSEEEKEEHLAPTVPTPALHSSIPASEDSNETEPFEEGETAATPPPFRYRVAARISVQPHILMPFRSESWVDESIREADIPLRKRARFTTPTGGYEIGESSIAAAARQIRPTLTIAESRRAEDRLIGRLRRERPYFRTLSTTYAQEVAHSHDYCTQIMDYCQSREVHTSTLVSQIEALQRDVIMSSDSHTTITYTSMSSYEVIVNGYYGMSMDPLDPYVQLIMEAPPSPNYIPRPEAPPSPDYIPRPEAPPSPDYIPGPEAPPSPDYILGPEYPKYLPPADDVLPAEEQPLLAADDVDDEEEEESSDSEEEKEEYLASTVPAPALYSFVSASEETEPFEEGKTAATPPPFGYRVATRISVQPHILMPFRLESEVKRLLAIPTPSLSSVSPTAYPLPPFLMSLAIFTPLPTSSFPLPSSLPSTSGSESIPEADIPLRKRARFTTPTGGYEVGESSVAAAARQIRHALTIADRCRADDRLIGRLRREAIFSYFVYHLCTGVTQIEALQRNVSTLQRQHIEHAQRDVAPEDGDSCS